VVARGEVWWSESPEWSRRPVVVLTRGVVADRLTSVMVALVTRTIRSIPTEVMLDEADGMPVPCVINLDNVATQPVGLLTERITRLGPDRMQRLCEALKRASGC
jgi:mRNA interferase MazF